MAVDPTGHLLVLGVEHNGRFGLQFHRLGITDRSQKPAVVFSSTRRPTVAMVDD